MEPPDAAQDLSAVLLQYESNPLNAPLSPSNHVTQYCIGLPALEPRAITQTQPNTHTRQTPNTVTHTGLIATEPMSELDFLQQLLCRWIHLPNQGPLLDLSQSYVP